MNFKHPYDRLAKYYSLIGIYDLANHYNENSAMSINKLHQATAIPKNIIRQDLNTIFLWQKNSPEMIETNNEYYLMLDDDGINSLPTFPTERLLTGELDDMPIVNNSSRRKISYIELPVTTAAIESLAIHKKYESKLSKVYDSYQQKFINDYLIKESFKYSHWAAFPLKNSLDTINNAIIAKESLLIKYKNSQNLLCEAIIVPAYISYDTNENLYHVLAIRNDKVFAIRLDRIQAISISPKKVPIGNLSLITKKIPQVWGISFNEEPIQVKIVFYNEGNVWRKVQQELASRRKKRLYRSEKTYPVRDRNNQITPHEFLIYEDTIYGLSKFKSWLRGYGSSAVVIEPLSLRKEMLESFSLPPFNHQLFT